MSKPTRYQQWSTPIMNGPLGHPEPTEPDPDPSDPIDYAAAENGGFVQVAVSIGSVAIVNDFRIAAVGTYPDWSSDFTPTINNVLLVFAFHRNAGQFPADTGWDRVAQVGPTTTSGDVAVACYAKVSDGTETTFEYAPGNNTPRDFVIMEISGVDLADIEVNSNSGTATTITTGSVTPPSGRPGIIIGASGLTPDAGSGHHHTPGDDWDELYDSTGTAAPFECVVYQIVASTSGSYNPTMTVDSLPVVDSWRALTIALTPSEGAVWEAAPAANDGDDATYAESNGSIDGACLRVALEVERLIYRSELRIAYETAGSKTLELYGSDDAAFTSPVLLDSQTFSATGSFTPDDVTFTWVPTATFQYYQIGEA